MSAFIGAVTLFNALAFLLVGLAFAGDSLYSAWSLKQRPARLPHDGLTTDERILTTVAPPNPGVAEKQAAEVRAA